MKKLATPAFPESICLFATIDEPVPNEWKDRELPESPKRQRELLLGRHLLRSAVIELGGRDPGWIAPGENRIPEWPAGIRGSLSHTDTAAIVWAHRGSASLGVDLQTWLSPEQAQNLRQMAEKRGLTLPDFHAPGLTADESMTLLFCIQESVQKCLGNSGQPSIPLASIRIEKLDSSEWGVKIDEKTRISGHWVRHAGLCVTFGSL